MIVVPCKAALALTRLCRSSGIVIVVLCPLIAMIMYGILYLQLTISYTHLRLCVKFRMGCVDAMDLLRNTFREAISQVDSSVANLLVLGTCLIASFSFHLPCRPKQQFKLLGGAVLPCIRRSLRRSVLLSELDESSVDHGQSPASFGIR